MCVCVWGVVLLKYTSKDPPSFEFMSAHCEEPIDLSEAGDDVIIGFIIMK